MYAVFDLGAVFYWAIPTAPPWWAALHGDLEDRQTVQMRRMMIEYGEQFWGDRWDALYDVLGGNPLAAMPSLHFATSLMAAHLLTEVGPVAGAVGWTYAATLGLALVYLGEHYVADLLAGAALAETVRRSAPKTGRLVRRVSPGRCSHSRRGRPARAARDRSGPHHAAGADRTADAGAAAGSVAGGDAACRSFTRRRLLISVAFVVSAVAFLYFVLPKLLGLKETWNRIQQGNAWWLALGVVLEVLSFFCYVLLFRAVFVRGKSRIDWRESYEITMSGLAATRLFAAGGAGGIALTAWALRRSGMEARIVACRMIAFLALLYGVYMATLVIVGLGLYLGVFPGPAPFAITVDPGDLRRGRDRRVPGRVAAARRFRAAGRAVDLGRLLLGRLARRLAAAPATRRHRRADGPLAGALARPLPARGDRLVGIRHRGAVGVLSRVWHRSARRP